MSPSFLHQLAQARPDPGGGAAAAYSADVALALLTKVIRLEISRPRIDEAKKAFWAEHLKGTRETRKKLAELRRSDAEAYLAMVEAAALGQPLTVQWKAVEEATRCPWEIMEQSIRGLETVSKAGKLCRPHLLSDLLVAVEILAGALQGAHHIAAANLPQLPVGRRNAWSNRLSETSHLGLETTLRVRSQLLARTREAQGSR